jgi:LysR family transcriptional regulator, glycine cleavage system transcriptional activator
MKRQLPPLHALRAFEAAARLGRMTAAADELCVTPGAISRQVRLLEEALQCPLFTGPKAKPTLTAAGRSLLPALSAALDQMETAIASVTQQAHRTLDVACLSTFAVKWLIPRLFDFHAQHPHTQVRLCTTDTDPATPHAPRDATITVVPPQTAPLAGSTVLFAEHWGPVLTPTLASLLALTDARSALRAPLLHSRTRPDAWAAWCAQHALASPDTAGTTFEHYYFTLQAALGGLGLALAPWHLVQDDVQQGRLVAPWGFDASGWRYEVQPRQPTRPETAAFCQWLQTQAQHAPAPPINQETALQPP